MRFIAWNLALAAWLLISAFVFPHTAESAALTWVVAVVFGIFGIAAPGLPGLRFFTAVLAFVLGWASLLLEGVSWPARVNNALVAAAVFALCLVPGRATGPRPASSTGPGA
jgi:hypothetical protein